MKYFTFEELTYSKTAVQKGINNKPQDALIYLRMQELVEKVLDPARMKLNSPIIVNSGYRCEQLNTVLKGAKWSYHLIGAAADVYCSNLPKLFEILQEREFDELIYYRSRCFIHVAYSTVWDIQHPDCKHLNKIKIVQE